MPSFISWFSQLPAAVTHLLLENGIWITMWVIVLLSGVMGLLILMRPTPSRDKVIDTPSGVWRFIRRHTPSGGYWPAATVALMSDDVPPSHWAISNEPWREHDHTQDAPSTGRRSVDNPARTIVPRDWRPPIGSLRIALMETPTSQYMIVSRPQPRSSYVRPYVSARI
jgi:hypothetical protein